MTPEVDGRGHVENPGHLDLDADASAIYTLTLFVSGASSSSARAVRNVQAMCEAYLSERYELTVVDVHQDVELARRHRVLATPTLLKQLPAPEKTLVGDFSDLEWVRTKLGISVVHERHDAGPGGDARDTRRVVS